MIIKMYEIKYHYINRAITIQCESYRFEGVFLIMEGIISGASGDAILVVPFDGRGGCGKVTIKDITLEQENKLVNDAFGRRA